MKTTLTVLLIIQLYGLTSCVIKRHYLVNLTMTHGEALNYCETNFKSLSTFLEETEEHQFLKYADGLNSDAWVGLWKKNGMWLWTTGAAATYVRWDIYPPNTTNCAYLNKDSKKTTACSCTDTHIFFCMKIFDVVVVHQSESWEGALDYCRHHHDDLASLSTNRSMTNALSKITGDQTQYVWIGLRFLAGRWFWISGDDLIFKVWSSDEHLQCPAQNQRCAALDKRMKTWTPRDCEEKLNFLCSTLP